MFKSSFDISAFVIQVLILIFSLATRGRQYIPPKGFRAKLVNQHFIFLVLVVSTLAATVCSIGTEFMQISTHTYPRQLHYLLNWLYFIFHSTMAVCFVIYVMDLNGTFPGRDRGFYALLATPYILSMLLILTTPLTNWVFYLDKDLVYHRGPLIVGLYIFAAVYLLLGFGYFIRYRQAISRADRITILVLLLIMGAGVVIQALRPELLVELFGETLGFLGIMILLEDRTGEVDNVTRVLNRRAFANINRRLIETGQKYSLVLVKLLNLDMYSQMFSGRNLDLFQTEVADFLKTAAAGSEIYHFRREDFAVILPGETDARAQVLARVIFGRFETPWQSEQIQAQMDVLVCVIRVPEDVSSEEQLQKILGMAYHPDKPGSRLMTSEDLSELRRAMDVEQALRRALERGTLQVWYQPIWSPQENRLVAAEALSRLRDETLGWIPPDEFIPVAESAGLIRELGLYVFEQSCRVFAQNELAGRGMHYIEVNVSLYQFLQNELPELFDRIRAKYGVTADQMNLEITEGTSSEESAFVIDAMQRMTKLGYTFSLDDYGTGYSNLVRLLSSKYENVKIDKSILWDAEKNESAAKILSNLTMVLRSLGHNVVQEGVETKEQLERVVSCGCNLIQGYYFSRPLPEEEFIRYVHEHT